MVHFFQKLSQGLKKSSSKIGQGVADVLMRKKLDTNMLEELEEALISADMGVKASARLIDSFKNRRFDKEVTMPEVKKALCEDLTDILKPLEATFHLPAQKPCVVLMVGVNGAGKTTTIGKLSAKLSAQGKQVSFIAADTFRAAAKEQLEIWAAKSGARIFTGAMACDSAGLCFDGLKLALEKKDDVVFIDTAGRLQNKSNLMDELQKIVRVIQKVLPEAPHYTWLTLDATTGQNAVSQVEVFKKIISVDGLIVTKLDGSAKGGILAALAAECPTPVYYVGVGEQTEDLDTFKASEYAQGLIG